MSLLACFGYAFFVVLVWWYYNYFKYARYYTKYKGPTPLPFVGNMHKIPRAIDFIPAIMEFQKQHGSVIKVWFGYFPRLMICNHRLAELLLKSNTILEKAYEYYFFQPWLGLGILTSTGAEWRKQRKLITPAFHFQILEQFMHIFHVQSRTLVENLRKVVDTGPFDVYPFVNLFAMDVICEATMGTKVNAQKQSESIYVKTVRKICEVMSDRTVSLINYFDCTYVWSKDYALQQKALSFLHGYTRSVISTRKQKLAETNINNENNIGTKNRLAFLDLLLQCKLDGTPLPLEHIREQADTIMFEGHDTTSSGIAFTLYCLSRYPTVQNKVVEEIRDICGPNKDTLPTHHDLNGMKYLDMVIKESMRLFPPVPVFARQMSQDEEFDGILFPKGSTFSIFLYGLHRQEEFFPDPESFDPERFSPENSANRPTFAYIPFSAGSRNCIGQRFAIYEMKTVIVEVLKNYELLPVLDHKPIVALQIILKSVNGLMIRLKERSF